MTNRIPNLNLDIVNSSSQAIGLTFVPECDEHDKNKPLHFLRWHK